MAGIEKKMADFSNLILNEAKEQRGQILSEVEAEKNKVIQDKELEFLGEAYEDIQKAVARCEKAGNERVLRVEMDLKKGLIHKREAIIEEVFRGVREKIDAFKKTPAYADWLVKLAQKAAEEVGRDGLELYLAAEDMALAPVLEAQFVGAAVLQEEGDSQIGGVMAKNTARNVFCDYSIAAMLEQQKQDFLKISGLSIR